MKTDIKDETEYTADHSDENGHRTTPRIHVVEPPTVHAGVFSAMKNETFHWENNSGYHKIDISFVGNSPLEDSSISVGNEPVPAKVIGKDGAYLYTVHYRTRDGEGCKRRGPFIMHVDALCKNCTP
jgi:hypothetical protein